VAFGISHSAVTRVDLRRHPPSPRS
jgi:hypothetical protein